MSSQADRAAHHHIYRTLRGTPLSQRLPIEHQWQYVYRFVNRREHTGVSQRISPAHSLRPSGLQSA